MLLTTLLTGLFSLTATPATDTVRSRSLEEVVVTATRTERPMGALPMPVTVIEGKQIRQMGSLRLNDVLGEQTGLAIVTNHGQGVQMQGFNPDYTLILIDGEPLVGRTAGTLELSRLAVGNIKRIEIVKGPSSSLYGSEALAGVINIITENPGQTRGSVSARYGANQTSDLSGDVSLKQGKVGLYAFGNRLSSAGFDLTPDVTGQTVSPFVNYTGSGRITADLSSRWKLNVSGRYFTERQDNRLALPDSRIVTGPGRISDVNLNPTLMHRPTDAWKLTYRFYHTTYQTNTDLAYEGAIKPGENRLYDSQFFRQTFNRPEVQVDHYIRQKHILTLGAGYIAESVEATRYTQTQRFGTRYGFFQYEWLPTTRLNLIAGGRVDVHSQYAGQFSPKLSGRYELTRSLALRGSVGVGFKAPDFRQLYLNFDNAVAGYSVFGTEELAAGLARLQQSGQIAEILLDPAQIGAIRPESSTAYNIGFQLRPDGGTKTLTSLSLNLFRNDVRDLIETQPVARRINGQAVFSYFNLSRVFTQGAELEAQFRWAVGAGGQLMFSAGYQFLDARDKAVLDQIDAGQLFKRNPETLVSERVRRSDYGGLLNRSRHMANARLFYENTKRGYSATLRGIYRSRYGFADRNGNLILDDDSEYVRGYVLWNLSAAKTFRSLTMQAGIDNLLGHTDPQFIPNLPGRIWYVSARWVWAKKYTTN
ncbi:TonB-dependent receptor plug domain-containing protein [Spirosoma montaniterrae]|uniref:Colicin I receptor n=1 Tax=Spirosoma montaniterrae TaxID=1178516 RepID=A0A1P9WWP8_9BACT|nr:TonB-dependent receptor [Spirosoma montaniterrae]AQG79817.1 colicin I receptor [Spirosoma montaniterrae]